MSIFISASKTCTTTLKEMGAKWYIIVKNLMNEGKIIDIYIYWVFCIPAGAYEGFGVVEKWITKVKVIFFFFSCRCSQSTVSNSNKYESREKINAAAQRTLLIDSGSETDSNAYESYAAVREGEGGKNGNSRMKEREKGQLRKNAE